MDGSVSHDYDESQEDHDVGKQMGPGELFNFAHQDEWHVDDHADGKKPPLIDDYSALARWRPGCVTGHALDDLLHLTADKVHVGADETELAEEQRDISKNLACLAIDLLANLRERSASDSMVDFDQHLCAPQSPDHR